METYQFIPFHAFTIFRITPNDGASTSNADGVEIMFQDNSKDINILNQINNLFLEIII